MSDEDSKEEAVPFLIYDQNTKVFTLTEQGEEVIKSLNGDFGVISVAGMYRTGKSYLLNRMLLNRQKGFSVGPTVNPCTKGLWIWSKPIYGNSEDGSRLPMLLIDTEGFGALDEDSNHDIRIFTLSILLSSYFVYNSLGSIDENALQNLNFVINLSKYIQLKNGDRETDPEELANLFPSFLWVLRDFSLQLIDDNDDTITPKEYLEKVLEGTKSIQDPKNKIRKLIKAYFKDRDCFTLIRPLTNENQLQSLETLEPNKLRPEFLEGVLHLRKKILSRVKVKALKGKALNSEMYLNLIKNLITAINSGKVPNIENTWSSMCKVESYKAFEDAELLYETYLKENLGNSDETLDQIHRDAKEKCIELFKKKALGDASLDYSKQLKQKIKEKYGYYSKLQDEEIKGKIIRILNKWYSILETRIQSNEFKSIEDINKDFNSLEQKLNETFPNYQGRNELFNDFKTKVFSFAGDHFSYKAENDIKFLKDQSIQQISKLTNDMEGMKTIYQKDNEKKTQLLIQNKNEITDLKEQIVQLQETVAVNEKEKDITANNFNSQLNRMKDDFERKLKEAETKKNNNEEKQKEAERKVITIKAECDKEKALLNQKIDHLNKLNEDYSKREKETSQEMKSQLREQSIAFKDKSEKLESTIKTYMRETEGYKEKMLDLEASLQNADICYQNEKIRNEEILAKSSKDIKDLNEKLNTLKKFTNEEKAKIELEHSTKENELTSQLNQSKLKVKEIEVILKTNEDSYRAALAKLEREIALLKQENTMIKSQNEELTSRLAEQKQYYENIISNLESKTFAVDHEEFQKKIDEIKVYYEDEKRKNEDNFEKSKLLYTNQIDKLTENYNQCQVQHKNTKDEYEKDLFESKMKLDKITKDYNELLNEKNSLNDTLLLSTEEANSKFKLTLKSMEQKLEEKEHNHQENIYQLNKASEETLNQLKALFETEKIRLEEKLREEKSKNEKKIQFLMEDYEGRIKDLESDLREENETLQNDLNDLDKGHSQYVSNAEHEIEMLNQRIDNTETALREAKDNLAIISEQNKTALDNANEAFNKERKDFQNKIDQINSEYNTKEKEFASMQYKKEQMEKIINDKEVIINQLKDEYSIDKLDLQAKYEDLKKKFNEINDQNMIKQLEYTRENALLAQQIEFLNKKNEETGKVIEGNQKRYEERLFALRAEVEKDLHEKFVRIKAEKEELEGKLLTKKKEIKELEQSFTKQSQQMSKESSDANEKLVSLQRQIDELTEAYHNEKASLDKLITRLTAENNSFKDNLNSNEKSMKTRLAQVEVELSEKINQYEKDQILWNGKISFIEQQRDTLKKDLSESSKRFEALLDTIQKKNNTEKDKIESTAQNAIANLEQKYQKQIKDIQENHNQLYTTLLNNNKELDRELKNLSYQNEMNKNKTFNPLNFTKQIEEMSKEKDKYKQDEETKKSERENQLNDIKSKFEEERDLLKKKITDAEGKLRDVEGKRGVLVLELAKEKAMWNIEKDNLSTKTSELGDKLMILERKNETLLRENEKLKNEKNNLRKANKNDSKYSAMFQNQNSTILGASSILKSTDSSKSRAYGNNQMLQILNDPELNGSKFDFDNSKYDNPLSPNNKNEKKEKMVSNFAIGTNQETKSTLPNSNNTSK